MKQFLSHFRISLLLGASILACCGCQFSATIFAGTSAGAMADTNVGLGTRHVPNSPRYDAEPESSSGNSTSSNNPDTSKTPAVDSPETSDPSKTPSDRFAFATDLIIRAVNPGYTIDKTPNVGEFIELQKLADAPDFSLAGYGLRYMNSSGNSTLLLNFSEGSLMTGENLLMRFARSPGSDRADATYMTTLALTTGRVELIYRGTVVDSVCWGSGEPCLASFKSSSPTTLLRSLDTGTFQHVPDYEPSFDPLHPSLVLPPDPDSPPDSADNPAAGNPEIAARCYELEFSEILSYYANDKSEQFVELYNPSDEPVTLSHCALRYKKKTYSLSGEIAPDGYYAYYPAHESTSFSFTKDPNSSNTLELLGADGTVVDTLVYNHGQKKSTSYARFYTNSSEEVWDSTYAPTPGSANTYQEFRSCPAGKIINPDTGNCVNPTSGSSTTTICPEGKYLNPLTGRCKNLTSDSGSLQPCAAGYERNPTTNRCRKIKSDNTSANYALVPNTSSSKSVFIAAGVVALIMLLGVGYIILQFRREIARTARKAVQRLNHVREHLVARRIRFHRKKKP